MKSLVVSLFLGLISQLGFAETDFSAEPEGTIGYFCQVRLTPSTGTLGNYGYILSILWSKPNCTGSYVGHRYFCSTGASSNICPSSSAYHYDKQQLLTLFQEIRGHVAAGKRVIVQGAPSGYTCNHNSCGAVVDFYSN